MTHSSTDVALFTHNCNLTTVIMSPVWSYIEHTVGQEELANVKMLSSVCTDASIQAKIPNDKSQPGLCSFQSSRQ